MTSDDNSDLENLKRELQSSLNALKQQEQTLAFIDSNEAEKQEIENQFHSELETALSSLENIPALFNQATNQINNIYQIAQTLSFQINLVDQAFSRCSAAAEYVKIFADLKECLGSIESALSQNNVSLCCNYISRLVKIPSNLLENDDIQKIDNYKKQTLDLLRNSLKNDSDPQQIFKYFQDCDASLEGIESLSYYQFRKILEKIQPDYMKIVQLPKSSTQTGNQHIDVFVSYLDSISTSIKEVTPIIQDYGQIAVFIRMILKQSDDRAKKILESYSDYRSVSDLCNEKITGDAQSLNQVCDEISVLSQQYFLFQKFLKHLIKPGLNDQFFKDYCKSIAPGELTESQTGLPMKLDAKNTIMELLSNYFILTRKFFIDVIENKLIASLSELKDNNKVTETVGDIFFFFLDILARTIKTNSANITVTILNIITEHIEQVCDKIPKLDLILKINFIDITVAHLTKLTEMVEGAFKHFTGDDLSVLSSTLNVLRRKSEQLNAEQERNFNEFMAKLSDNVRDLLYKFRGNWTNETVAEITITLETELESSFSEKFDTNILIYKKSLNRSAYNKLIAKISDQVAINFLEIIKTKKFDHRGSILLDRIVRFLASELKESSFERLKQIALILTRESPEEVVSTWNNADFERKLKKEEVIKFAQSKMEWKDEKFADLS